MKKMFGKQSAIQQTMLYGLGIAIMKGVSLLILPIVARYVMPEDYGRLEVLTSLAIISSVVVGFGLTDALFRFTSLKESFAERQQVAADILGLVSWLTLGAIVVAIMLASVIADILPGTLPVEEVRVVLLTIAFEGVVAIPLSWLRLNDHAMSFFLISTGKALLQAMLTLLFLVNGQGVFGVVLAGLIATVMQALLLFIIQTNKTGISFYSRQYRNMLIYGVPLVGSGLVLFLLNGIDRWILAESIGNASMAQYAIAAKFALAAALLIQPFTMWWMPRRYQVARSENGRESAAQYAFLGIGIVLLVGLIVMMTAPLVMTVLLPEDYSDAKQYIFFLILIVMLKESGELLNLGCFIEDITTLQFVVNTIAALTAIVSMLVFSPVYGIYGVIGALIAAQVLRVTLYLYFSQKIFYLPYRYSAIAGFIMVSTVIMLLGLQLDSVWIKALYAIPASILLVFTGIYLNVFPQVYPKLAAMRLKTRAASV